MKKFLNKIFIKVLVNLINLNLYFLKDKNYIYSPLNSYGDCFEYYLKYYNKCKNRKILVFGVIDKKIVSYFFGKKSFDKIFFYLNNFSTYGIFSELKKKKNFKPFIHDPKNIWDHIITKKELKQSRNILFNVSNQIEEVSPELKKIIKKKYILMHVKHYHDNTNDISLSASRQTSKMSKIFKLINHIIKRYNVIILGINTDKHINIIRNKFYKNKKVIFLNELSNNYSISDQIFCYKNSLGYIGSSTGIVPILWLLKKKIIMFDAPYEDTDKRFKSKNFIFLPKKYKLKNKPGFKNLNVNIINNKNLTIKEASLKDLKKKFDFFF